MTEKNTTSRSIIRNTFYIQLTAFILLSLSSSVGSMIDGVVIGQFLGVDSIAAFGIINPLMIAFSIIGAVVAAGARNGVSIMTIHCQGGKKMCQAAMEAAEEAAVNGDRPYIFGVTALTSFGPCEMPGIASTPQDFALQLARSADGWGIDGVVCSGLEVKSIKMQTSLLALCPGIRPAGADKNDQVRVCTPLQAVKSGADFLVVGRPITRATDPAGAAQAILEEMAG